MVQVEPVLAAGLPSISTLEEPTVTWARCVVGTMNGSLACSPTCGGVFRPDEPCTAAGLPLIRVLVASPLSSGAAKGSGGAGCGAPVAGLGIWWSGQVPVTWSPITAAGVPMYTILKVLVELDRVALDLDRTVTADRDLRALQLQRRPGLQLQVRARLDGHVGVALDLDLARSEEHTSELQSLRHLVCR